MSSKIFEKVKMQKPQRSSFDLSHDVKMSAKFGLLYPIMNTPVVPGDVINLSCESLIRFAPMVAPVMHRINVTMHYFYVPYRLLWENWEKFISNTNLDLTGAPPVHPFLNILGDGSNYTSLMDYMGITPPADAGGANAVQISALHMAAYQCVYNEYYRDQNLIPEIDYKLVDGNNDSNLELTDLRRRAWMHDYFTSALPFAQKGDAVDIPINGLVSLDPLSVGTPQVVRKALDHTDFSPNPGTVENTPTSDLAVQLSSAPGIYENAVIDPNGTLIVDNAQATINDLRIAMRVQEWLEKNARGGTRYNEFIRAHFGVQSSDARLQRPEYITGIKSPVIISEVLNNTGTASAPQGSMAGHGVAITQGNYGKYYAEEFGCIIGVMSITPETAYQQGIPKHFLKTNDFTEYYFPSFANLGEQEIKNAEIFAFTPNNDQTFGYIPRYSEYKYENNRVAGDFRQSLNFWHLGRIFASLPTLSDQFINCSPRTSIFAVDDGTDYLWCQVYNKVRASRLMPYYGTPTF